MAEISIVGPDGAVRRHTLTGPRVRLGRSAINELCYADDIGLSRQHLYFERNEDGWTLHDPGSKNGTRINGERLRNTHKLEKGDRIHAGHLTITFGTTDRNWAETVVVFDAGDEKRAVSRQLSEVLPHAEQRLQKTAVNADRVGALIRAGQELASHRALGDLFITILNLAIEAVDGERGVLLAYEGESLDVKASSGGSFRISSGVRDRVLRDKVSLLVNDVQADREFRGMQSLVQHEVRMFMAAPLQTRDQVLGLIYVDSPTLAREFTVEDLNLLTVMANVAAIRIEHARLAEVEQAERILSRDLEQAAIIQRSLLPGSPPVVPGIELAAYNMPCRTVGGDYYDFLPYPDGRIAITLGDVSGKAMPAALLMTSLQARLRVLAEQVTDLADLMTRLNRHTAANTPPNRFITLFFMLLDPGTGQLTYTNAGHNPPLLIRRDGTLDELDGGGLILGPFPQARYQAYPNTIEPGETIVLFSDGVTEATDAQHEEFGEARLRQLLTDHRQLSAGELIHKIADAVSDFTRGAPATDDVSMVVIRRIDRAGR